MVADSTASQPERRVLPEWLLGELRSVTPDIHPVFHVEDLALQACATRLAPLLAAAQTHDERAPLDYLLGALHALFRSRQLGFVERPVPLDDEYWNGPLTRVRYMQDGDVRTDGSWLAGFYFNAALARIAAAFDRLVALVELQSFGEKAKNQSLGQRLEKLAWGKWRKRRKLDDRASFILQNGETSRAYRVYDEVNFLKHEPKGLAMGREATMDDAIAALTEIMDLTEGRVRFSGAASAP